MTLKTTRLVRNMLGIGGTVCVGTFGFSLASSRSSITRIHSLNSNYGNINITSDQITNVNHVEDFEYANGCKFLFYENNKATISATFNNGNFKDAREASKADEGIIKSVKDNAKSCVEGSYVFIHYPQKATT